MTSTPAEHPTRARWSLRRRLVVSLVALVALVCAVLALVSTLALRGSLVGQLDARLLSAAERASQAPAGPGADGDLPTPPDGAEPPSTVPPTGSGSNRPPFLSVAGQAEGTLGARVLDGEVIESGYIDSNGEIQPLSDAQTATLATVPADGAVHTVHLDELGDHRVMAVASDGGGVLITGLSLADADQTVRGYLIVEAIVVAFALVVGAALATGLVQRALRPLERVRATATRVAELPLHSGEVRLAERLDAADSDPRTEVGQMGAAFNRMVDHVESALTARQASQMQVRQFVADASHELRTPLASIRGYAELVRRSGTQNPPETLQALDRIESESVRMTGLVEDLLLLARLDAGRPLRAEPVDLAALAIDCVADAHAAGPDHRWQLELDDDEGQGEGGQDLVVEGDDARVRQVLVNLLANARVHTPAGTTVVVGLHRVEPGARASGSPAPTNARETRPAGIELTVTDDGPGIAPDLRETLFERFTRADSARSRTGGSTGLGLAIAQAVVLAHGGTITVESVPGRTQFRVFLPAEHAPREADGGSGSGPTAL